MSKSKDRKEVRGAQLLGADASTVVLNAIAYIAIARVLGPEAVGVLAFAMSFVGILGGLLDPGASDAGMKKITENDGRAENIGAFLFLRSCLAAIFVVAAVLTVAVARKWTTWIEDETLAPLILLMIGWYVAASGQQAIECILTACRLNGLQALLKLSGNLRPVGKLLAVVAGGGVFWIVLIDFIGAAVSLAFGWWLLRGVPKAKPTAERVKDHVAFCLPISLASLVAVGARHLDSILVKFAQGFTATGVFSLAGRVNDHLGILSRNFVRIWLPDFSSLSVRGDQTRLHASIRTAVRHCGAWSTAFGLLACVLSEKILGVLFGPGFGHYAPILQFVFIAGVFQYYAQVMVFALLGSGFASVYANTNIFGNVLRVALATVLIPDSIAGLPLAGLGIWGAVIANLAVRVLTVLILLRKLHALIGLDLRKELAVVLFAGVSGMALSLAVAYLGRFAGFDGNLWSGVCGVIFLVGFSLMYFRLGGIRRSEIDRYTQLFLRVVKLGNV